MQFSLEMVREVARLLQETDLAEVSLEVDADGPQPTRLTVRRVPRPVPRRVEHRAQSSAAHAEEVASLTPQPETNDEQDTVEAVLPEAKRITLRAAAVGLFRQSAPPRRVGESVRAGEVLGSVESMKIPTEIVAPVAGTVVEQLVEEGQGVEYNQPLLVLETV
jgi:biotin carboxyl carrier protein